MTDKTKKKTKKGQKKNLRNKFLKGLDDTFSHYKASPTVKNAISASILIPDSNVLLLGVPGTGKTTLAANLGADLARRGKEVLIIDTDIEMGNMELVLGIDEVDKSLLQVLSGEAEISEAIYEGPGGVKVVPAGVSLDSLRDADPERMDEVLEKLKEVEILIMDAPAGLERGVLTAISASNEVLLVVNPEISSMGDALKTKIVANKMGTHVLGAVLNRATFDSADLTAKEMESVLETRVLAVVPEDPEVKRASAFGEPVVLRNPGSPASMGIKNFATKLVGE